MKKITSQKLSKRLVKYGALSVAIAGVADASGQIIYTDIADVGGGGVLYQIDLNNDAIPDFAVRHFNSLTSSSSSTYNILACAPSNSGASDAVLGVGGAFVYPFDLSSGAVISNSATSWNNDGFQTMNYNSCAYGGSNWCANEGDKYLGLKFTILNGPGPGDDTVHYGWARIEVGATSSDWLIKDYAYNTTPDEAITAGQMVLGLEDNTLNKIKIVALNKSIAMFNLPQQTNYRLFSLTGQSVLNGNIENSTHVIEANTLATGVYILELEDGDTNAVIRKKVVL